MKILGIKLNTKRPTEEDYIEMIRKKVSRSKWFGRLEVFFAMFFIGSFLVTWKMMYVMGSLFSSDSGNFDDQGLIYMIMGAFAGLLLAGAIHSAVSAARYYYGLRTERMLLKYHDDLYLR